MIKLQKNPQFWLELTTTMIWPTAPGTEVLVNTSSLPLLLSAIDENPAATDDSLSLCLVYRTKLPPLIETFNVRRETAGSNDACLTFSLESAVNERIVVAIELCYGHLMCAGVVTLH
jgi:hypothetical protein